jgi:hypothetical protein
MGTKDALPPPHAADRLGNWPAGIGMVGLANCEAVVCCPNSTVVSNRRFSTTEQFWAVGAEL